MSENSTRRDDDLLTINEVAKYLRVEPTFVRRRIADGSLRSVRLGSKLRRVYWKDLQTFIDAQETANGDQKEG